MLPSPLIEAVLKKGLTMTEVPYVGMAWATVEHADAEDVLEGCLLTVNDTHEAAYNEISAMIEAIGQTVEEYTIIIRRAK